VYNHVIKRLFDILLGIVALPFIALVLLVAALLIHREDKGPVFYNAPRIGRKGRPFIMYKLRSMRVNAPDLKMADGSTYNGPDDPRQTRVGALLRRTSIDELPQVLNVLKGDMSFIGPRPDLADEVALYEGDEGRKLEMRPGISGYAQVYGRNALLWHDRLALDGYYVDHQSFVLDLRIFFKTFAVIFSQEGVYVENDERHDE
jgi:lipopolysaccharide/colanic/teichoic acid biosynthesis glycosyltransferase